MPEIMMQPEIMSFSSAICGNLPTASIAHRSSQKCHSSFKPNQISVTFPEAQKRKNHGPLVIRTVRNKLKADIRNDDNGSSEPAVAIPERPLAKTQKLEKRTTEEDIRDAERNVLLENALLNCTKEDLECREGEIAAASAKQKQMEEDLKQANADLAFRSIEIVDLRLLVEEHDKMIASSQSALALKEDEMNKLRDELTKKNEEASLQIERMKSEQASLQLLLQEKDFDLLNAKKELADASRDISEIQRLLNRQEEQLIQATAGLEKEEYVSETPDEVDDLKLKFSDVTSSVQRIDLVSSTKDNESGVLLLLNEEELMFDGVEEECVLLQEGIDNQTMEGYRQRNSFRLETEIAISVLRSLTEMIIECAASEAGWYY